MNNTIVIRCEAEGFTGNWIEYRTAWTGREIGALDGKIHKAFLDAIAPKTVALHIETTTGKVLERVEDLTVENLLDCDVLVWAWLSDSPLIAIAVRSSLGKASGRPSFTPNGSHPMRMTPGVMDAQNQPMPNAAQG